MRRGLRGTSRPLWWQWKEKHDLNRRKSLTNCGAREGDALILTKPLGTGVLFNACRSRKLPWRDLEPILPEIASPNRKAVEIALKFDVHACTDITGFGIVGHSLEMAKGSGLQINLFCGKLPFFSSHRRFQPDILIFAIVQELASYLHS